MSRVGKAPITIPSGVEVTVGDREVTVSGPQGTLTQPLPGDITLRQEDGTVLVERPDDARQNRALHGLVRALVANMVEGVTSGFAKELEIIGVGYRVTNSSPSSLELALGYSHPVRYSAPDGVTFEAPTPTSIVVRGVDKQAVGQVAANIRAVRKPEPYKGKGVRYAGERIIRKAGKAGK